MAQLPTATSSVPVVRYLELGAGGPRLVSQQCTACGARYFDARRACARCGQRAFTRIEHPRQGTVATFTIVHRAGPGVETPFVSAVVRLADGTPVKANVIGCPPDTDHVRFDMAVELQTFVVGQDAEGTDAVAFGFAPVDQART